MRRGDGMPGLEIDQIAGRDVYGMDGKKIGTARQTYADDQTGDPAWATVRTGLLGLKESFVPLTDAELSGDRLTVPYTRDFVKDAPNIDEDGDLTPDEEQELYAYYGRRDYDDDVALSDQAAWRTGRGNYDTGRTGRGDYGARDGDAAKESGRARLRKYMVTEDVELDTRGYN